MIDRIVFALLRQTRVHFLCDAALLLTRRMFDRAFRKAPSISNWIGAWHFSLEAALQSAARNHRGGSEVHQSITHIDLITPETIDELIAEKLREKEVSGELLISERLSDDIIKSVLGS